LRRPNQVTEIALSFRQSRREDRRFRAVFADRTAEFKEVACQQIH
jgi:hypothetical protein